MPILMLLSAALAGDLVVDVKVPVTLSLDGQQVADVFQPGVLRMPIPDGAHKVTAVVGGKPQVFEVTIGLTPVVLLVGRSGTTVGAPDALPPPVVAGGDIPVRFRSAARDRLLLQIGGQRVVVAPGVGLSLPLSLGEHEMTVRSPDGTSIYARGVLVVAGVGDLVVQLAEGKMPETSGPGLSFDPVAP